MTQATEPDDRDRSIDRQFRILDRRITRLEETQLTGKELSSAFDRVYDEIDALEEIVNRRFDEQNRQLEEQDRKLDEHNRKIDIILSHITGQNNS